MRSKVLLGGLGAVLAFLLATNPLVAQAAGFITSADIVNSTIKGKDVKNNGLTGKDIQESTLGEVPLATTAKNVAAGSINSSSVADGSLTAADVSLAHGRVTHDFSSIPADSCDYEVVSLGPSSLNLDNAAIVVTPDSSISDDGVYATVTHAPDPNAVRLFLCNPTGGAIDPPSATYDWIAFNVVP